MPHAANIRKLVVCAALVLPAPAAAQLLTDLQPGRNFVGVANFGTYRSENIDVGDADLDGDLDVIVGNGGDGTAQANRIYINNGSASFTDETALRFLGVPNDTSRDIEFVDHDNDGDLDIMVANRGTTANGGEVSRFYVNLGGLQSGATGFYNEDTNLRWGALVSVPLGDQIFGGNTGPFRDNSGDCDFGDLDDDGDLDLFFSRYGNEINGSKESRVFLNDGHGVFHELYPWADPAADIKTHTLDIDLVDFDGDFDLDVFNSSRNSQARVFLNNLGDPLPHGTLFTDITQTALYATGALQTGQANYECEPGDVDGDGDFDVWLLNYNYNFDRLLRNDGAVSGGFQFSQMNSWIVGDPNQDENELDFGDYDGDGDLDAFAANFSGTNWIYQSGLAQGLHPTAQGLYQRTGGGGSLAASFPETPTSGGGSSSLDGEWADLDGDGDLDILVANDNNGQNWMYRNDLGVPDTHAPTFAAVESGFAPLPGDSVVVHVALRDNAPYYLHMFYDVQLRYAVDGRPEQSVAMFAQGGQQYRGTIPAQAGLVAYHVQATDLAGNTGISASFDYVQGAGLSPWSSLGYGLPGALGVPVLAGSGTLIAGSPGSLKLSNAKGPNALAILFVSLGGTPAPFKGGTLAAAPIALQLTFSTLGNPGKVDLAWAAWPAGLSGASLVFQYAIADPAAVQGVALSNAVQGSVP